MAVTHHQPAAPLIPLVRQLGEVRVDLRFQRGGQHPARPLPNHLIQQRDTTTSLPILGDYSQHGRAFPTDAPTSALLETYNNRSPGKVRPSQSIHSSRAFLEREGA
jgi:hypothetical protein